MGVKKISANSEEAIIRILRQWPRQTRLTWESLRSTLTREDALFDDVWSRQALSSNENIYAAYLIAKDKNSSKARTSDTVSDSDATKRVRELEVSMQEMELKYNRLLARHAALIYNVSLLEGGSHLFDPLPDNTKSQKG